MVLVMKAVRVGQRLAPLVLLVVGSGMFVTGLLLRPRTQGIYVSPHPWADYVTAGAIVVAAGLFESMRRVLRQRGAASGTMVVVGIWVAVGVAMVIGAVAFVAMH
jgi:hypothetical protein